MRIVVLSLDGFGDMVLRQPLLRSFCDLGHEVVLVAREPRARLARYLDARARTLTTSIDPYLPPMASPWSEGEALASKIREFRPELVVCAPFNRTRLDDWLLSRLAGVARCGFGGGAGEAGEVAILERGAACEAATPELEKNALLHECALGSSIRGRLPEIALPDDAISAGRRALGELGLEPGSYVLGVPAPASNFGLQTWPAAGFVEAAAHLGARHGLSVLIAGDERERAGLKAVVDLAAARGLRLQSWVGGADDLGPLLALIKSSRFYMGADTGTMHFAAALDKPVLARFGGGTWPRFLPQARRTYAVTRRLPCFGCSWDCWIGHAACLSMIPPEKIIEGIDWILSDAPDERRIDAVEAGAPELERLVELGLEAVARLKREAEEKEALIQLQHAELRRKRWWLRP